MEDLFKKELQDLINKHSKDGEVNTPDYVLTEYLMRCMDSFRIATQQRDRHNNSPSESM